MNIHSVASPGGSAYAKDWYIDHVKSSHMTNSPVQNPLPPAGKETREAYRLVKMEEPSLSTAGYSAIEFVNKIVI